MKLRGIEILPRYVERYWERVVVTPGCWGWRAAAAPAGYGLLRIGPGVGKLVGAHRLSYVIHFGAYDEESLVVRHRCDNPVCSNYLHLELGSRKENTNDSRVRGRMAIAENLPQTVMTAESVAAARVMWRGGSSVYKIAKEFGVTRVTMREAIIGQTWKHVPNPVTDEEREVRNARRRNR